jgi:hypothetical protein
VRKPLVGEIGKVCIGHKIGKLWGIVAIGSVALTGKVFPIDAA